MLLPAPIEEREQAVIEHVKKIAQRKVLDTSSITDQLRVVIRQRSRSAEQTEEGDCQLRRLRIAHQLCQLGCWKICVEVNLQRDRFLRRFGIRANAASGTGLQL